LTILRRDRRGRLVLIEGLSARWGETLRARFARVFPESCDRVQFLPRLGLGDFLDLLRVADALLDPMPWGGGNTAYEAFAVGAPIVTLPGAFMRGRVTAAAAAQLGVTGTVVDSIPAYVETAVRLANDPGWRRQLGEAIVAGHDRLYADRAAVAALEDFFVAAVDAAARTS
jgi:predicted O-linked N-acetylglucosamine transferase (SPINDLY family)